MGTVPPTFLGLGCAAAVAVEVAAEVAVEVAVEITAISSLDVQTSDRQIDAATVLSWTLAGTRHAPGLKPDEVSARRRRIPRPVPSPLSPYPPVKQDGGGGSDGGPRQLRWSDGGTGPRRLRQRRTDVVGETAAISVGLQALQEDETEATCSYIGKVGRRVVVGEGPTRYFTVEFTSNLH
ncbi:major facilitator superfamily protein [Striga asiatica]|uniref:Major facilitator superfamily protein n=1 Tax=Striga asiatica TaxID=4170 RepID=A0A5A7PIV5_STRAF|nr:major facilitator superfamily protein [Striga asiatica]